MLYLIIFVLLACYSNASTKNSLQDQVPDKIAHDCTFSAMPVNGGCLFEKNPEHLRQTQRTRNKRQADLKKVDTVRMKFRETSDMPQDKVFTLFIKAVKQLFAFAPPKYDKVDVERDVKPALRYFKSVLKLYNDRIKIDLKSINEDTTKSEIS